MTDQINPVHYKNAIECIDYIQAVLSPDEFIGYLRGNMFKYLTRYKIKGGVIDLRKAAWYLDRLMQQEETHG